MRGGEKKEKINKKNIIILVVLIASILLGYTGNKLLSNKLYLIASNDRYLLESNKQMEKNINYIAYNYLFLNGATENNVFSLTYERKNGISSSSPLIIFIFIRFICSIVTILLPFMLIKKFNKMNFNEKNIYIFTVSLAVVIFFFLLIGNMSTWYRYITPVLFFLYLLYPLIYKYYFSNTYKNKILFTFIIFLFIISSLFVVITSYVNNKGIIKNKYQDITDFLVSKNLKFGYVYNYTEHNLYRLLSNNKLQITRIDDNVKPFYWLNSTDWYTTDYYSGKVFFMRNKLQPELKIENKAIKKYTYKEYYIYVFKNHNVLIDEFYDS